MWRDFNIQSVNEWKDQLVKDLKSSDLDQLKWKTNYGNVDPIQINPSKKLIIPKCKSFQEIAWKFNNSTANNSSILNVLQQGVNSIFLDNVPFDNKLYKDVMCDIIFNHIYIDDVLELSELKNWINNSSIINGTFRTDPISSSLINNDLLLKDIDLTIVKRLLKEPSLNNLRCLFINGVYLNQVTMDPDVEVAHLISHLNEMIEHCKEHGIDLPPKIILRTSIGPVYLQEIAKIRALNYLSNKLTKIHRYDVDIEIECVFNKSFLSPIEKENNLLRITTAYLSSIIGGSIRIISDDKLCIDNDLYWRKILSNIPLILMEESHVHSIKDIAKGSYFIEQLTHLIALSGWGNFKEIEEKGGYLQYCKKNKLKELSETNKTKRAKMIKDNDLNIIGLNCFNHEKLELKINNKSNSFKLETLI